MFIDFEVLERVATVRLWFVAKGAVDFSGVRLGQSTTQVFMVLAKYDSEGNLIWAKEKSGPECSGASAQQCRGAHFMTTDVNGNTHLLDWRTFRVSKHDSAGDTVWTRSFTNDIFPGRVMTDTVGNCYLDGSFQGTSFEFDGITVTNAGNQTAFVAKLETTTPPPLSIATTPSNTVTLAWSALAENFYVESASELGATSSWTSNEVVVSNIGLSNILTLPLSGDRTFYRLKRP